MQNTKNWIYNGKRIKIVDTRIKVPDSQKTEPVFTDEKYYLAIWDKSLKMDIGSAKQSSDGTFTGYVPHGMGEISISGKTIQELAQSAYHAHLWSLQN